jgi:hypothetical protein
MGIRYPTNIVLKERIQYQTKAKQVMITGKSEGRAIETHHL